MEKTVGARVVEIDVDDLPDAYGPPPSKELVDSVAVYGVIQPVLISRAEDGSLVIVDGNRRIMAARKAKVDTMPAIVIDKGTEADYDLARLTLQMNNLRSTNDYAEQMAYDTFDDEEAEQLAKESGLSRASIAKRARWSVVHTGLVDAFYEQRIAPTVFDSASKLPADLQVAAYREYRNGMKLTAAMLKDIEAAAKEPEPEKTPGEIYAAAKADADRSVDAMLSVVKELHGADMREWIDSIHHKLSEALEQRAEAVEDVPWESDNGT